MKLTAFTKLLVLALVLTVAATGCRKKPGSITPLPGRTGSNVPEATPATPLAGDNVKSQGTEGFPVSDPNARKDWPRDREIFKSDTVHFDYDSSVVRPGEKSKIS